MATGFITRHCSALLALAFAAGAAAQEVSVVGTVAGRAAVLVIDGGEPRTVRVGAKTAEGVTVISVESGKAVLEFGGRRRELALGQHVRMTAPVSKTPSVTLAADSRGHFVAEGQVNGHPVRFLVDTGATMIALPGREAQRLGIDYTRGTRGVTQTANGPATAWRVRLERVRIGDIEMLGIEAVVLESGLDIALLGMTFLNRVEMRREGPSMTLTQRF